ncbi:MAG TPA: glycine cleavage system protein GcvH [Candidatus Acidoferrum sp.]|nr:glycine cleavage system protein GcvH [Candidatus Acidoferrum sp.]
MYPADYRYSKEHEWIKVDGPIATLGITDYAQQELGDVVFVEAPKVSAAVMAGKSFGTVESVKAVSEVYSPVTGEITETNPVLEATPEKINSDPHGEGWLVKIRMSNPGEVSSLMDAAAYQAYIAAKAKESTA